MGNGGYARQTVGDQALGRSPGLRRQRGRPAGNAGKDPRARRRAADAQRPAGAAGQALAARPGLGQGRGQVKLQAAVCAGRQQYAGDYAVVLRPVHVYAGQRAGI